MEKLKTILRKCKNFAKGILDKFISSIKKMGRSNLVIIIIIMLVIILFAINLTITFSHTSQYSGQVQSGQNRWLQVDEIINGLENRIDMLESRVVTLEEKLNDLEN